MKNEYLFCSTRLGFRNWGEADIPKMVQIAGDPEVMEFFPAPATPQQTAEFIGRQQKMFQQRGHCYFAVEELESGNFIGFIGLMYQSFIAEFTPCVDIGWRLGKQFWNQGYATEGAKRCLSYAFQELKLAEVLSTAPQINLRSLKVMQKIGMKWKLDFVHPRIAYDERLRDCACYQISEKEFAALQEV